MATLTELQSELTEINAAISHILKGGQEYEINTGSGGTIRKVKLADLDMLRKYKNEIESKIQNLNGTRATYIRPNW